jgi:hypothetical protein
MLASAWLEQRGILTAFVGMALNGLRETSGENQIHVRGFMIVPLQRQPRCMASFSHDDGWCADLADRLAVSDTPTQNTLVNLFGHPSIFYHRVLSIQDSPVEE